MVKAILCDFDGTIVDSEESRLASLNFVLKKYGIYITREEWDRKYVTLSSHMILNELKRDNDLVFDTELMYKKAHEFREEYLDKKGLKLAEGFSEFYEFLERHSIPLIICSGGKRDHLIKNLARVGLSNVPFIAREDYEFDKPRPDCYLAGLKRLNVKKEYALAIDDSVTGVRAAQDAGLRVVALNCVQRGVEQLAPVKIVKNFKEIDTRWLYAF